MHSVDYILFDGAINRRNYPSIDWLTKRINVAYATKKITDDEYLDLIVRLMDVQ